MTETQAPSAQALRRAQVCWEQSRQDLKRAKGKLRGGEYLESAFVSLQAALNGLATVCYLHGHFQLPLSSPVELLALCREADRHFEALEASCLALEAAAEQNPFRTPPGEGADKSACQATYGHSDAVLSAVRGYLKENRKRFFSP